MNELYKFIEKIFHTAFNAGRLYTFENKEVSLEKLDIDAIKTFHEYYMMKCDDFNGGKSWHDELEEFLIKGD